MWAEQHLWVLVEPVALRKRLGVGHVQGCPAYLPRVEGSSEGFLVDAGPAGHVDQAQGGVAVLEGLVGGAPGGGRPEGARPRPVRVLLLLLFTEILCNFLKTFYNKL